jgi:hypothetical protein
MEGSKRRVRERVRRLTYEVVEEETVIKSKTGVVESKNSVSLPRQIDDGLSNCISSFSGTFQDTQVSPYTKRSKENADTYRRLVHSVSREDHPGNQAGLSTLSEARNFPSPSPQDKAMAAAGVAFACPSAT